MRPHRLKVLFWTTLPVVALVAVMLGVVTARSQPGPDPPPPPSATGTSVEEPATSASAPPTTRRARVSRIIRWIADQAPLGGGADGPADEAFSAILDGDCAHALKLSGPNPESDPLTGPVRTLYEGAGAACLAAFEGRSELWARAEAARTRLAGQLAQLDCQQQSVYRLLERVLDAHRADPDAKLIRQTSGRRGLLKCPRFLKLTPDHGPAAGGYLVRIEGENLPRVVRLSFGEHRLTAVSEDGRHLVVTVPPDTHREKHVPVHPDGWPFGYAFNPWFLYGGQATTTTRSSTTTSTTSTTVPPSTDPSSPST